MKPARPTPHNPERRRYLRQLGGALAVAACGPAHSFFARDRQFPLLYCLIHGSTHGPGAFEWLARELRAQGHEVIAPSVPMEDANATAADCAGAVRQALAAHGGDRPVVAVAHSISGLFLPLLGGDERVAQLVYVAAAVPRPGQSFREQFQRDESMYWPDWVRDGRRAMDDPALAAQFLYHDCSPQAIALVRGHRIQFAAAKLWTDPFSLSAHPRVPTRYVVCSRDRVFQPDWMRRIARSALEVTAEEIRSGHCPHLAQPRRLARLLLGGAPMHPAAYV